MWVELRDFDASGLNSDLPARSLPPNAVTSLTNANMTNGKITKMLGYATVYGTPTVAPYHLQHVYTADGDPWIIYCGLNDVYSYYSATHTKITRTLSAYAATSSNDWTSTVLGGIPIINEGVNVPQYTTSPTTTFLDLSAWAATWTCKSIRAFREYLVAVDMTENATNYPQKLRWSHPADPGSLPSSWDETDTTKDAGYKHFSETPGILIDSLQMGGVHMVYKSDSTYSMQFIGGTYVFSFNKLFDIGIMARNCVVDVEGQHVFMSDEDIYIHNGGKPVSLLHKKLRDEIFDSLDATYKNRCRVVADQNKKQVWFLIPTSATGWLDTAWVWNWRDNTWGKYAIPNLTCASVGGAIDSDATWDSDSGTWDSDSGVWNNVRSIAKQLVWGSAVNTKLYQSNTTYQADGSNYTTEVERQSIDFGDPNSIKVVRKVRAHFNGMQDGTEVTISVGSQEFADSTPEWKAMTYTIGTTQELWHLVRGRYLSWKVSMAANDAMELESLEFDVVKNGLY